MSCDFIWVGFTLGHTQTEYSGATAAAARLVTTQLVAPHALPVKSWAAAGAAHHLFQSTLMSPEQTVGLDLTDFIQGGREEETSNMAWQREREATESLDFLSALVTWVSLELSSIELKICGAKGPFV